MPYSHYNLLSIEILTIFNIYFYALYTLVHFVSKFIKVLIKIV